MMITIFVSYSHKDDAFREQLDKHLAPMKRESDLIFWFDGAILPGDALDPQIRRAFRKSDIFVALGSHNYLHSDYCFNKEYTPALRRAARKTMRVVVALVGTCDWKHTRMAYYKSLPKDGKPVDQWGNRNKAYVDIVDGLRRVVEAVRKERKASEKSLLETTTAAENVAKKKTSTSRKKLPKSEKSPVAIKSGIKSKVTKLATAKRKSSAVTPNRGRHSISKNR